MYFAGNFPGTYAAYEKFSCDQFQHLFAKTRRRYGGRFHEYSEQRYAVRHAAPARIGAGRTAAFEL